MLNERLDLVTDLVVLPNIKRDCLSSHGLNSDLVFFCRWVGLASDEFGGEHNLVAGSGGGGRTRGMISNRRPRKFILASDLSFDEVTGSALHSHKLADKAILLTMPSMTQASAKSPLPFTFRHQRFPKPQLVRWDDIVLQRFADPKKVHALRQGLIVFDRR